MFCCGKYQLLDAKPLKPWRFSLWYLHINMQNQAVHTDHYTVPHTLASFFTDMAETFSINIHWRSIVALTIREGFSTDGR